MRTNFVLGALSLAVSCTLGVQNVVQTNCGVYNGRNSTKDRTTRWLGMRYAAPPVGNLRFMPPQDPQCVDGIQEAFQHGKYCLATGASPRDRHTSEDCLFIDVFAPTNASTSSRLPVFFFIQGGGFNSNGNPNLDGRNLIQASNHSIVVVTFNYRVGPYGFITDGDKITPNNGLLDQRKALQWVQTNIAKFGGDPRHVVLGGASAGAASISLQLAAYGGTDYGLFHGAAAESISFATVLTVEQSQYQYDDFTHRLGCAHGHKSNFTSSLACLRSKTAAQLQAKNHNIPYPGASGPPLYMWNPVVDGDLLRDVTYNSYAQGNFVKVPMLIGDDTNGGTVFTPRNTSSLRQSDVFLHNQFPYLRPDQLRTINMLYPNSNASCPAAGCYWRQVSDAYGDMRYMCPGLYISSELEHRGVRGTWNYRYDVRDPAQVKEGLGVPHVVEVSAIFGPQNGTGGAPASYLPGGINAHVVPVIQGYWTSFIRSLDPNKYRYSGSARWDPWTESGQQRLLFQTEGVTSMETVSHNTQAKDNAARK
ncbi:Alpha/Beta hydrolase protein [Apiospora rasikravindrae]|uniref:Carboxylic ester hydrolase n=1 Tax=Apiospora rasikravindrae TaxID=990691 RepID=A0ABR1RNP0_9PEZI